jgi:UDP-2,4-diacetamido-2,4,6-trideoxy-beta-L-altropyranose hydrolase
MRCLTLADALRAGGAICRFVCRAYPGNLIALVRQQGFEVLPLPTVPIVQVDGGDETSYAQWLGLPQRQDAEQTLAALAGHAAPEWLVVDHYALDECWERAVRTGCSKLLVIDDLANRCHDADILLDQTFGRQQSDYRGLINTDCELRCGVENVLLRPEFEDWRERSLTRRVSPSLKRILVSLGGVDKGNISNEVLIALDRCRFSSDVEVCLVLGESSPWVAKMQQLVLRLGVRVELKVAVGNMAELLASSDLVVGAAGTSAWERCCLGVPTLMVVLADNQREIASRLSARGAVLPLASGAGLQEQLIEYVQSLQAEPSRLLGMAEMAAATVPSSGTRRLAGEILSVAA